MNSKTFVSLLIKKLENLLLNNATTSNSRFKKQVQKAISNLQLLKQFLNDAEENEISSGHSINHQRKSCLLRAVYSAKDVIDTLLIINEFCEIRNPTEKYGFLPCLCFKSSRGHIRFTDELKIFDDEIRILLFSNDHLGEVEESAQISLISDIEYVVGYCDNTRLSFRSQQQNRRNWERISGFWLEEETDVVGLERQTNVLAAARLLSRHNLNHSNQFTEVIVMVGEGGSGKTTLARALYDRVPVKRHFTKRAWVRVPGLLCRELFKARDVLIDILKQINQIEPVEVTASEKELTLKVKKLLQDTRFLIVLEDVEMPEIWEALRRALCFSSHGGTIIVTTRNANNVPWVTGRSTLHLRPLNREESWQLFLNKVRILNNAEVLIAVFKDEILNMCGGLPLRIALLGGLMSTKEVDYDEWSRVINSGEDVLTLIYKELPSEIKQCFLYMGMFPREFEIPVRRLIHLWCAEGFVEPFDQKTYPEDLAEMYIEELVTRNMIQVTRWRSDGTPKTCRMPSVLYDIYSPGAANAGFFHHQLQPYQPEFPVRRLAAYLGVTKNFTSSSFLVGHILRSYVAFDTRVQGSPDREILMFLDKIVGNRGFGLLKVLDLEGVYKPMLSDDAIGKLLHLSHLGLRSTFIDSLPSFVGNLPHLETLDVKNTKVLDLPCSIWEAKNLQHLYLNWIHSERAVTFSNSLSKLRTLWGLSIKDDRDAVYNFRNLTSLRKLGVTCSSTWALVKITNWVAQLTKLQSLKLVLYLDKYYSSYLQLQTMVEHHMLQELYLLGKLPKSVIDVQFLPPNLKILTLSMSELEEDPMPTLGQLRHLKILRLLAQSYKGEQIKCLPGSFAQLLVLKLWKLQLKEWTLDKGAMPCLRELEIRSCDNLEQPIGLQYVTTLKELVLTNMPSAFLALEESLRSQDIYVKRNAWGSSPLPVN